MNAKWLLPVLMLCAVGCGKPPDEQKPPEDCSNQIDDDGNGLSDCVDPACADQPICQAASQCSKQQDCFAPGNTYVSYTSTTDALPRCDFAGTTPNPNYRRCTTDGQAIELYVQLKKQWAVPSYETPGATVRLIKKVDVNGKPVNCDLINSIATGNSPADADVLEKAGRFNYLAFDARSVNNTAGAVTLRVLMNVTTGSDFLVFAELWTGKIDGQTHYPTNKRVEWRCYDSATQYAALLAPVVPEDDWPMGMQSSTSRTMNVDMPGPQNP